MRTSVGWRGQSRRSWIKGGPVGLCARSGCGNCPRLRAEGAAAAVAEVDPRRGRRAAGGAGGQQQVAAVAAERGPLPIGRAAPVANHLFSRRKPHAKIARGAKDAKRVTQRREDARARSQGNCIWKGGAPMTQLSRIDAGRKAGAWPTPWLRPRSLTATPPTCRPRRPSYPAASAGCVGSARPRPTCAGRWPGCFRKRSP